MRTHMARPVTPPQDASGRDTMGGLAKGLAVLEAFARGHPRATIAEMARATGQSRAAARRCLVTLTALGYARFDGKFYTPTPRVLGLGGAWLAATPLPELLQPALEQVRAETGESCSAAILDGTEVIYIARAAARRVMAVTLGVGSRLPAWCSALGRVLLARLDDAELDARLATIRPEKLTPRTLTDPAAIRAAILQARRAGYAVVNGEIDVGLRSLAVAVEDRAGAAVAAINIGAAVGRAPPEAIRDTLLPALRRAAATVGGALPQY